MRITVAMLVGLAPLLAVALLGAVAAHLVIAALAAGMFWSTIAGGRASVGATGRTSLTPRPSLCPPA